jgi:hypothetical protein
MPYWSNAHTSATRPLRRRCAARRNAGLNGASRERGAERAEGENTEMASSTAALFSKPGLSSPANGHVDSSDKKESMARVGWLNAACSASRLG